MANDLKAVEQPTWRNTMNNDARKFGHIDELGHAAADAGYPYICWNDRIYAIHYDGDGCLWSRDTSLTVDDID